MPDQGEKAAILQIRTNDDLTAALTRIDELWGAKAGSQDDGELDILVNLAEDYGGQTYPAIVTRTRSQ